jgi:alpha-galactosidase
VGASLWRTTGDINDHYASMERIGFSQSDLAAFSGPGHWNDPDMLEVGNGGMSTNEYKTHFSLWTMIAAPLIAGNDIRSMSSEDAAILQNSEVIAIDQDSLGAGGKRVSITGGIEIWQKPLASGDIAIAIFNHSTEEMRSVISWETLSIGKDYAVRDLWGHADRGSTAEAFSEPVSAHGVIVLRLHRIK